jgi:hypothetical protein
MSRQTRIRATAAIVGALVLAATAFATASAGRSDLDRARAATAPFNSLNRAQQAGYALPAAGPLSLCIASFDGTGAMGYHFINGSLLDGELDPTRPEVLVYAPEANGKLRLVAAEYVVFMDAWSGTERPTLFGHPLHAVPAPNRYEIPAFFEIHAWLWEDNPAGTFEDFNPDVTCD